MLLTQFEPLVHFPKMRNNGQVEDNSHNCSHDTIEWYADCANVKLPWYAMGGIVQEEDQGPSDARLYKWERERS